MRKFRGRIVAQEMVRRGPHSVQIKIMEPRGERPDAIDQVIPRSGHEFAFGNTHSLTPMTRDPGSDCNGAETGKIECPDSEHRFANVLQSLVVPSAAAALAHR
jgi:hypothetical protein